MTALSAMRHELGKVAVLMYECVTPEGYVKAHCKYEYQDLVRKYIEIKEGIEFLEDLYAKSSSVNNRIKSFS